jgi:hypothetical protein
LFHKFVEQVENIFKNRNFSINPGKMNKMLDTAKKICFNAFYEEAERKRGQESCAGKSYDGLFYQICEENSQD